MVSPDRLFRRADGPSSAAVDYQVSLRIILRLYVSEALRAGTARGPAVPGVLRPGRAHSGAGFVFLLASG